MSENAVEYERPVRGKPRKDWPAFNVERRAVGTLKPYRGNARRHSDEQVGQIADSIREWGWTQPILVDVGDQIIAGHGRLAAAKLLGVKEVPVIVARGWSKAQKRAYVLADNQLALNADWDQDLLKVELGALGELGFDLELLGFGDLPEALPDEVPDEVPAKGGTKEMSAVVQFNIVFDDPGQQEIWFGFVRRLKALYPEEETLGARLARHIQDAEA